MKIYAINGSPRKNGNTATLLKKALEGIQSSAGNESLETKIINLYDLNYTGCKSCFACKRLGGSSYGKCVLKDDITDILDELSEADGIILGAPVYINNLPGMLQSFLERFIFPYYVYDENSTSIAPKKMPTAFIYTMNLPKKIMYELGYVTHFDSMHSFIGKIFTPPTVMYSNDTYQFDDYSKYKMELFSEEEKAKQRATQFPLDCQEAFNIGFNLIRK